MKSLNEWRKAIKAQSNIRNPYDLLSLGIADVIVVQGGNGNGYRNDRPWVKVAVIDGESKRFGRDTMPDGFAPVTVNGIRAWLQVPAAEAAQPCSATVSRAHGRAPHTNHPCDKASDGDDGLCGQHRGVAARAAARTLQDNEKSDRSASGLQIATDAVAALGGLDVAAKPEYFRAVKFSDSGYTGAVVVHAEDVLALVRELGELRALRDML